MAIRQNGGIHVVPVEAVETDDPTGAGDTFAGGFLAAWLSGADPRAAAKTGAGAARAMLVRRAHAAAAA